VLARLATAFLTTTLVAFGATAATRPAAASNGLTTAIVAPDFMTSDAGAAYDRVRSAGATAVRIMVYWNHVSPRRPADPIDPRDPAFHWGEADRAVRLAVQKGLQPIVDFLGTPSWAAGAGVAPAKSPSPIDLGQFAKAAASRYSGSFSNLPRVRYWQVWNEPNLTLYLTPQQSGGKPVSPGWYRDMVNRFADGVKSIHPDNLVIAGGTSPFGNSVNLPPLRFMRELLCLSTSLKPKCKDKTHFDIWAHHPYTSGGPTHHANSPGDVSLGDLPEMRRVLLAGVKAGNVVSNGPVKFWVTEFSWDTKPPDPKAVPIKLQSRWVAEALYRMWKAGVSLVTWFTLQDEPITKSFFQSGLFFGGTELAKARPKPTYTAFRFPVVGIPVSHGFLVWGRTPAGKRRTVIIQQSFKGGWARIATLRTDGSGIFQKRFRRPATGLVRARLVGLPDKTLAFRLRRGFDQTYDAFGKTTLDPRGP
jgi:Cellulase (glycosyl hydrolase family 5)